MTTVTLDITTRKVEAFSSARDVQARADIATLDSSLADVATSGSADDISYTAPGSGAEASTVFQVLRRAVSITPFDFTAAAQQADITAGVSTWDAAASVDAWLAACASEKKKGFGNPGTFMLSFIDRTFTDHLNVELMRKCEFKGFGTLSEFDGDGAQTVFTVTDDWVSYIDDGFNVQIYDTAAQTYTTLTDPTDYGRSGATFTLAVAPAVGKKLRITSQKSILRLAVSGGFMAGIAGIDWRGGTINSSLRGHAENHASGTGISIDLPHGHFDRVNFICNESYWQNRIDGFGDSGITGKLLRGSITRCAFVGMTDGGIYLTGENDPNSHADDGGEAVISGNSLYRCAGGIRVKRQMNDVVALGNTIVECNFGIAYWPGGGNGWGGRGVIANNALSRIGTSGITVRNANGISITGNTVEDYGMAPSDGITAVSDASAFQLSGVQDASVTGNSVRLKQWAKSSQRGFSISAFSFETVSQDAKRLALGDNKLSALSLGYYVGGSHDNVSITGDNLTDVDTVIDDAGTGLTQWDLWANGERNRGKGNTNYAGAWIPEIAFAGGSASITHTTQNARYERKENEVTVHFDVRAAVTHSETTPELRITGLPFQAAATGGGNGHGALGIIIGLTWPSGTIAPGWDAPAGQSYIRLRLNGTPARFAQIQDVSSGVTVRLEGTVIYRTTA